MTHQNHPTVVVLDNMDGGSGKEELLQNDKQRDPRNIDEKKANQITIDELYSELGEFGRWQWLRIGLLCLPAVIFGFSVLSFSFTGK